MDIASQLPRAFQANADRFYQRIILVTLGMLPTHDTLVVGQANTEVEFLEGCAAQVDNHTANETAKAFALALDGMFERQLATSLVDLSKKTTALIEEEARIA